MAKIRLTESQLKQIVTESVKRVLIEGELWDTLKDSYYQAKNSDDIDDVTNQEFNNFIRSGHADGKGETNYEKYRKSRDDYKRAEKGSNERLNAAYDAVADRPGVIGNLGRRAMVTATKAGKGVRRAKDFINNKIGI